MKKKHLQRALFLFGGIALVFCLFVVTHSSNEDLVIVPAELYVNEDSLEMPAYLYWYSKDSVGKDSPRFDLPLEETIEHLGCKVEKEEQRENVFAVVRVSGREYFLTGGAFACDLTEGDQILVSGAAQRRHVRWRGFTGPLYMADVDYEEVLKALGFDQISLEIDKDARIIKLTAHSNS